MMTMGYFVTRGAREFSDQVAFKFKGKAFTFSQINERVNRLANGLMNLGVKKGDRVAILLNNCTQWPESDFACMKSGFVRVGLNARYSVAEHEYALNDCEASTLIVGENFLEGIHSIQSSLKHLQRIVCVGQGKGKELNYEELISKSPASEPQVEMEENDLYRIAYTSGTTGKPKGVMITHKAHKHTMLNMMAERGIKSNDVMLHVGPLSHASGSYVMPHWIRGAKNVIMDQFDVEQFLETIQNEKITNLMMVPTMIIRLLTYPGLKKYDLSSIRSIGYGAAPMAEDKIKAALKLFGPVLSQGYGQMEAPMTISYLSAEDHVAAGSPGKEKILLSAGKPYIDVQVKIVDDDDQEVPLGEVGEIAVRSDHQMLGYWKKEKETLETIKNGWIHTRDMGYMDKKGYLYLVDRKGDMIISGGFNIYPREIEEVLNRYDAVMEVAVFSVPDEEWGESVKALVVLKPGMKATEQELVNFCTAHLTRFKKPKSIEFVDDLPKNAYGKIDKKILKDKYWAGRTRRIN
jgi:long-chain acyl-CoA synthetase